MDPCASLEREPSRNKAQRTGTGHEAHTRTTVARMETSARLPSSPGTNMFNQHKVKAHPREIRLCPRVECEENAK